MNADVYAMCGIAGFSVAPGAGLDPTLLARVLLAGIAERGADASGVGWTTTGSRALHAKKAIGGATALIPRVALPDAVRAVILHVRDTTKGTPRIEANNHPIRHGSVLGVHNGRILDDEQVLDAHGLRREVPGATVDSEALFALLDHCGCRRPTTALRRVRGPLAAAWLDERRAGRLSVARGRSRPLSLALSRDGTLAAFASTSSALELVRAAGVPLEAPQELDEGVLLELLDGRVRAHRRFEPQPFVERRTTRPAPSPLERRRALRLVAETAPLLA